MPPAKTPMQEQWAAAKAAHPDALLLFRMGDFYEMFGDDAKRAANRLGLTLTTRDKGKPDATPMAGVPYHALDRYLKEMLAAGWRVAICEQLESPAAATGIVKRGVVRVVTPGTVVDDACLTDKKNNFLLAVAADKHDFALALADISTGEFFVCPAASASLREEVERYAPSEILAPVELLQADKPLAFLVEPNFTGATVVKRDGYEFSPSAGLAKLTAHFAVGTLDGFGIGDLPAAVGAAAAILSYLEETQKTALPHLKELRLVQPAEFLLLDYATQRNLEIIAGANPQFTLLGAVDRTRTAAGGRLLKRWLLQPLRDLDAIAARQQKVGALMRENNCRERLRDELRQIADFERMLARLAARRGGPRDLAALGAGFTHLPIVGEIIAALGADSPIFSDVDLDPLADIAELLNAAIVDAPPLLATDGGFIKSAYSAELTRLRELSGGGKEWLEKYERRERERTGIASLKVGFNRVFGYYLEVTNTHRAKIPPDYRRQQTLANAERCSTPELKKYEEQILGAEEKAKTLESEIFAQLTAAVLGATRRIQTVAATLAQLDVLSAFADLGATRNYILPTMREGIATTITAGRHPALDQHLADFTPNDTAFDDEHGRLHIITGPNMAGKSTYIRQVALLTILAQAGAPIPAAAATIGVVDRVFTRIGAADDLARGQSTFMVEMAETANILHNATTRSLIILDEVGRGTSTFDGVSLAWAITEYLHETGARTLFATHYHELAELGDLLPRAQNYNVAVREWQQQVIFLHTIAAGAAARSYGLQVAKLAGLPKSVLTRAKNILQKLEKEAARRDSEVSREGAAPRLEISLFEPTNYGEALAEIAAVEVNELTPLAAQQKLAAIVERCREAIG
ncbi:DNA mismatch repair protein MutS [Planctomycetales bacterium]|nr:DNA mismatch repair protein MutS [Planctomycetales bacterium]